MASAKTAPDPVMRADQLLGWRALADGLRREEPVIYSDNGFRSSDGRALLARLRALRGHLGISRLAELSQLSPLGFPVFQSTRPHIFTHPACGQNTGSQGKGQSALQSQLSCLMEEVESYSAEPRRCQLIRARYSDLRHRRLAVDPRCLTGCEGPRADHDEPLMWIEALRLGPAGPPEGPDAAEKATDDTADEGCAALLPAEAVLFPFFPERYATASRFPCSSNGLAAGASYLEAVIHGLYEVIERAYQAFYERDEARVSRLSDEVLRAQLGEEALALLGGPDAVELLAIELPPSRTNLPMLICLIHSGERTYAGYGLSANVDISVARAVSEAMQSYAVDISGSREDLEAKRPARRATSARTPLSFERYRARVIDRRFETLGDELAHVLGWVRAFGFPEVLASNLTRAGVDIPVVKVVVPGLPCPDHLRQRRSAAAAVSEPVRHRYAIGAQAAGAEQRPRVRVYSGLSVEAEAVEQLLPGALVSPPAQRGDLARDIAEGVDVVVLIDGRFQQSLAVSVGELADALRCGVRLYGASSMGALRAVELSSLGMRGHGEIFAWVRDSDGFRDDYLGLIYAAERPQLRGVAYADVHFALRRMRAAGELSAAQAELLGAHYRALHFAERDLAGLLARLRAHDQLSAEVEQLARAALHADSQKTLDARSLLRRVAAELRALRLGMRELSRSVAGARRFPFFDADEGPGLSLRL